MSFKHQHITKRVFSEETGQIIVQNIQQITAAAEKQFAVKKSQNKGKQAIAHYVQKKEDSKSDTRPSL